MFWVFHFEFNVCRFGYLAVDTSYSYNFPLSTWVRSGWIFPILNLSWEKNKREIKKSFYEVVANSEPELEGDNDCLKGSL